MRADNLGPAATTFDPPNCNAEAINDNDNDGSILFKTPAHRENQNHHGIHAVCSGQQGNAGCYRADRACKCCAAPNACGSCTASPRGCRASGFHAQRD